MSCINSGSRVKRCAIRERTGTCARVNTLGPTLLVTLLRTTLPLPAAWKKPLTQLSGTDFVLLAQPQDSTPIVLESDKRSLSRIQGSLGHVTASTSLFSSPVNQTTPNPVLQVYTMKCR